MDSPAGKLRERLLDALLERAPEAGWTRRAIYLAAADVGLTAGEADLAAPRGPADMIDAFADRADRAMTAKLAETDLAALKIRERVALAVRAHIEAMAPHRAAARRAAAHLALKRDGGSVARFAWRSADRLWRALGDPSTDENYYSKRLILGGVISGTIGVWLVDESDDLARTWGFLDARIENVMQFERFKAKARPARQLLVWRAVGALANMRYRATAP